MQTTRLILCALFCLSQPTAIAWAQGTDPATSAPDSQLNEIDTQLVVPADDDPVGEDAAEVPEEPAESIQTPGDNAEPAANPAPRDDQIDLDGPAIDADPAAEETVEGVVPVSPDAIRAAEDALEATQEPTESGVPQPAEAAAPSAPPRQAARPVRQAAPAPPARFVVRNLVFTQSGYLTDDELARVEEQFVGRSLTLQQTDTILEAINSLYENREIVLAQALLADIDISRGIVSIELFEARIGKVTYERRILSERYLAMRIGIRSGDLADVTRIQRRLDRLALTDGIRVEADFSPGAERGLSDLNLRIAEPRRVTGTIGIDTYGSPGSGEERVNFSVRWFGITGWNDAIEISGNQSHGATVLSGNYGVTVTPSGTRLGVFTSYETSETLLFPEVEAETISVGATVSQPIIVREDLRLSLDARAFAFNDESTILGQPLLEQRGGGIFAGASGFASFDGTTVSGSLGLQRILYQDEIFGTGNDHSTSAIGSFGLLQPLPLGFAATVSAGGQYTFDDPPPSEYRTTVAGFATVRGYPESLVSGDSGFFVRTQLERLEPISIALGALFSGEENLADPGPNLDLRPFAFFDYGRAYDVLDGEQFALDPLYSAGAGVSINLGGNLFADLFAAVPLRDSNGFSADEDADVRFSLTVLFP